MQHCHLHRTASKNGSMSKLFEPIRVGRVNLRHRVALAPLTRFRADDEWVPLPIAKEYYEQRASEPGTLLITEGTLISKNAAGRRNVPGIWSEAQIAAWKDVVDAVHGKGSYIYCQLWATGRAGAPETHKELGTRLLSSSAVAMDEGGVLRVNRSSSDSSAADDHELSSVPEEMTEDDIHATIRDYATAAKNAIRAGFDGVEIHAANGYLVDQFTQDTCNRRTDGWGGSVENRARFGIEVAKAVVEAVGADRTAVRLSPFSTFQGMLMEDPHPQFAHLIRALRALGLAYLHLVEPRVSGVFDADEVGPGQDLAPFVRLWDNRSPVVVAGGFASGGAAAEAADDKYAGYDVLVAFGRRFISNPDLVFRLRAGVGLAPYDRDTFYTPKSPVGYVDYPFSPEYLRTMQ
ncbi:hypothetical protein SLS62_008739 [Diatrype stigma]|uniref:NADH:flavin oxidoreductase/NADH oxidase N-terminal domain-containing protein n=1 Tax=Diatrype stigma TaxID=117547 RepID=A0AAN9YMX2_9PEZI